MPVREIVAYGVLVLYGLCALGVLIVVAFGRDRDGRRHWRDLYVAVCAVLFGLVFAFGAARWIAGWSSSRPPAEERWEYRWR